MGSYNQELDISGLQGLFGDGENSTFFIAKTQSQAGGFLAVTGMPPEFKLGGPGQGFTVVGPGHSVPIQNTALSITHGIATSTVDTSQTAISGAIYKVLCARGTASPYNETYYKITSSNSSQWVGTPYYLDGNPAIGAVTSYGIASNVLTWLENNVYRKIGYIVWFSNTGTALDGTSATITSIVYSGTTPIGYTAALTAANVSTTAITGTVANLADTAGVTDNFAAIPRYDGVRLITNNFPAGSNIMIHPYIGYISCSNFSAQVLDFNVQTLVLLKHSRRLGVTKVLPLRDSTQQLGSGRTHHASSFAVPVKLSHAHS